MSKVILELDTKQVETLVEKLPIEDKIRLARKLEHETWARKFETVVGKIRRDVKRIKISDKEIDYLCEEVKREYDEKHRRH